MTNSVFKINFRRLALLISLTSGLSYAIDSFAANKLVPSSADVGLVMKNYQRPTAPQPKPLQHLLIPTPGQQVLPAQAAKIRFQLTKVDIEGVTAFPAADLAKLYQPYLSQVISLVDLQKIVDTITLKYRNAGYVLSRAILPPQQISQGVVKIRVIEGYIDYVKIQGNVNGAMALLLAYGNQITHSRPLQLSVLERYLLLANDLPGVQVKAVLTPSPITSGSADLTLVVSQKRYDGYISYDNRGTRYIGPQEFLFGGDVNSLFTSGDQTGASSVVSSDTKELKFLQLHHTAQLGQNGLRLNVSGSITKSNPGFVLEEEEIEGRSNEFTMDLSYPIYRSRQQNFYVHGTLDSMNSKTDILKTPLYDEHIRSLRVGTSFDFTDRWFGVNGFGADLSKGLSMLGASSNNSNELSRPKGRVDYTKVNLQASRLQALTNNLSLLAAAQGQYAFNPLLASEQFSYGGSQYGQAYDASEITGDHGLAGKLELRYDSQPDKRFLRQIQYFTFYDAGIIWNKDLTSQVERASGTSLGLGARMNFTDAFSGNLVFTQPLTRPVAAEQAAGYSGKSTRVFFGLTLKGDGPSAVAVAAESPATTNWFTATDMTKVSTSSGKVSVSQFAASVPVTSEKFVAPAPVPQPAPAKPKPVVKPAKVTVEEKPKRVPVIQQTTIVDKKVTAVTVNQTALQMNQSTAKVNEKPAVSTVAKDESDTSNLAALTPADVNSQTALLAIDGSNYTIELMESPKLETVRRFIKEHHLQNKVAYFQVNNSGRRMYVLVFGRYETEQAAVNAMDNLPEDLQKAHPWIRTFASMQENAI